MHHSGGSASFNVTLLPGAAGDVDTSRAKVEYKYATDEGESVAKVRHPLHAQHTRPS